MASSSVAGLILRATEPGLGDKEWFLCLNAGEAR